MEEMKEGRSVGEGECRLLKRERRKEGGVQVIGKGEGGHVIAKVGGSRFGLNASRRDGQYQPNCLYNLSQTLASNNW